MSVYGAGSNDYRQLVCESDAEDIEGCNYVRKPTRVPIEANDIQCISSGYLHSVFIYKNGAVFCAGDDSKFQIGTKERKFYMNLIEINVSNDPITWVHCGSYYTIYLTQKGEVIICSDQCIGKSISYIANSPVRLIAGSCVAPCAIDSCGVVYLFDKNPEIEPKKYRFACPASDIARCNDFAIILTNDNILYGNGKLNNGKNEFVPIIQLSSYTIKNVFGYSSHAAVISNDGKVLMYGNNSFGQCGNSDSKFNNEFSLVQSLDEYKITQIALGVNHTIFITEEGTALSCGANYYAQTMSGHAGGEVKIPIPLSFEEQATYAVCGDESSFLFFSIKLHIPEHHEYIERKGIKIDSSENIQKLENQLKEANNTIRNLEKKLSQQQFRGPLNPSNFTSINTFGNFIRLNVIGENQESRQYSVKSFIKHPCVVGFAILQTNDNHCISIIDSPPYKILSEETVESLSPTRRSIIVLEVVMAMNYLHHNNIYSISLSPEKIYLNERNDILLFGLEHIESNFEDKLARLDLNSYMNFLTFISRNCEYNPRIREIIAYSFDTIIEGFKSFDFNIFQGCDQFSVMEKYEKIISQEDQTRKTNQ